MVSNPNKRNLVTSLIGAGALALTPLANAETFSGDIRLIDPTEEGQYVSIEGVHAYGDKGSGFSFVDIFPGGFNAKTTFVGNDDLSIEIGDMRFRLEAQLNVHDFGELSYEGGVGVNTQIPFGDDSPFYLDVSYLPVYVREGEPFEETQRFEYYGSFTPEWAPFNGKIDSFSEIDIKDMKPKMKYGEIGVNFDFLSILFRDGNTPLRIGVSYAMLPGENKDKFDVEFDPRAEIKYHVEF